MNFKHSIFDLLDQLGQILDQIPFSIYSEPVPNLFNATIGQHTRHILEFFIELDKGYWKGEVDYDLRPRNYSIETDIRIAKLEIQKTKENLIKPNKDLTLHLHYGQDEVGSETIQTHYARELVYNLEHMVHHMAMIRIGLEALTSIDIPHAFGIAESTLRSKKICVQ